MQTLFNLPEFENSMSSILSRLRFQIEDSDEYVKEFKSQHEFTLYATFNELCATWIADEGGNKVHLKFLGNPITDEITFRKLGSDLMRIYEPYIPGLKLPIFDARFNFVFGEYFANNSHDLGGDYENCFYGISVILNSEQSILTVNNYQNLNPFAIDVFKTVVSEHDWPF
jgi:hypothetical protein